MGCYSFHETKNFISGEGGAIAINDPALLERAEIIREKGTNRSQFFRGMTDKYTWVDIGSSYLPGELTAAFLYAQLEKSDQITRRRLHVWQTYHTRLQQLEEKGLLRRPVIPADCGHNAHMYYIVLRDLAERTELIAFLKVRKIQAVFHYVPLHTSPMGMRFGGAPGTLPVTEEYADRILRLPCYYELSPADQERVCSALEEFFGIC